MSISCPNSAAGSGGCDTVFDCVTSQNSFTINDGNPMTGLVCGQQVPITLLWAACGGGRAPDEIPGGRVGLSASGGGSISFNGSNPPALLNNYIYTLRNTPGTYTETLTWGNSNDPSLCTVTFQVSCEEAVTPGSVSFAIIDQNAEPEFFMEFGEDRLAEAVRQNPGICYFNLDEANERVDLLDIPEWTGQTFSVSNNTQLINAMQSASDSRIDGNGGTFDLPVDVNFNAVRSRFVNMKINPTASGFEFINFSGSDVMMLDVEIDCEDRQFNRVVGINGPDFEFVQSAVRNVLSTSTGVCDVFNVKDDRFNMRCSVVEDINSENAPCRAIRWQTNGASIEGGEIYNNDFNRLQANNQGQTPGFIGLDGEAMVGQEVDFITPVRIYGNRGFDMGKRFVKIQVPRMWVQSNRGHWATLNGPYGGRNKRAMFADQEGFQNRVRNNFIIDDYAFTNGETLQLVFHHNAPNSGECRWDGNIIEVNHPSLNNDFGIMVFNLSGGNPMYPPASTSMRGNIIRGTGSLEHHYWDRNTPGGNDFSGFVNHDLGVISIPSTSVSVRNS